MIDPGALKKTFHDALTIEPALPCQMTRAVVLARPFVGQKSLRFGITALLLEVCPDRIAAVMPDDGRWSEADSPASILQSPTDVDVVTSDAESGIKTPDRHQLFATVRHIAARNVLGDYVRQQHMNRSAWSVRNAVGDRAITRRGNIGTSNSDVLCSLEG